MKKILGLDLGVASIGWALINTENDIPTEILGIGSRIVPLSTNDANEFSTGNAISKNQNRTITRTQRKGYDRYQLRRKNLTDFLRKFNMTPTEELIKLDVLGLWGLRAKAANKDEKISLIELGRVLYHLNQKRGYKSAKSDDAEDKKQKDYVADVNNRYKIIKELKQTIGQYFHSQLKRDVHYRTKEQVFPRAAYLDEFEIIWNTQARYYPEILTEENKAIVRDEIIYYQRSLKSCKHLVSLCEFEMKAYKNKEGKTVYDGPKVAPRSSPLFQVCKNWESLNNLKLKNRKGLEFDFTLEHKKALFNHLDNNDKLTTNDLYKILGINKSEGWWGGKAIGKGLQGNTTKNQISKVLGNNIEYQKNLVFNLKTVDTKLVDTETGEIIQQISPDFEKEPLYRLWHSIYSIHDQRELANVLQLNFGITDTQVVNDLCKIDFVKSGFGNKSAKAIRRILPYLQDGLMYSEACLAAGFRHSESLTVAENEARELLLKLPQIKKNDLKQPVVEKILNQMVNLVNAVIDQYGTIDEIRVELARKLKQSKDERNATDKNMRLREKINDTYAKRIFQEYGLTASRTRIQKFRMWEEAKQKCFYCGQTVNVSEFLKGFDVEVEHIIPKSLFFDDSFTNKVCACRKCNSDKKNQTAFDYMKSKGEHEFESYLVRIEEFYKNGDISKTKKERLLTPKEKIPTDFIDRQLRETQYIARKAKSILSQVARNVWASSGSVTDFVRHTWGWDKILNDLQVDKYRLNGQTELVEFVHKNQKHVEERIIGWSKRLDHRHHAIDALTVACTRQSFIQRLNNLNTERDAIWQELKHQNEGHKEKFSLLEKWLDEQPHFSKEYVQNKVAGILVSFKAGKKAASTGKRIKYIKGKKIVLQDGITVPRGALHEESVYGKIKILEEKKSPKFLFEHPNLIFKPDIKDRVEKRIEEFEGDTKKAIASLLKNPVVLKNGEILEYGTCFKEEYIIKYPLQSIKAKDVHSIVDKHLREIVKERLVKFNNNEKEAFKDLKNYPLWLDDNKSIQVKTLRCFTGLTAVEPIKRNENGEAVGFVKPGNNHHIAIYTNKLGKKQEHAVTFWSAVERKKYGLPIVITNPIEVWDNILDKEFPENFLNCLPSPDLTFDVSLQQNEMFILGMPEEEYQVAIENKDYSLMSDYLYRVQSISPSDNWFRKHIGTLNDKSQEARDLKIYYRCNSVKAFEELLPHKVRINNLGKLIFPNSHP